MSKLIVGSLNKVKVNAVKNIFIENEVIGISVSSKVSTQPITDEETMKGAINRAIAAKTLGDMGIGLEGGVQQTSYGMMLVNYGALVDKDNKLYIAGGARILLPNEISKEIYKGRELGDIIDEYANKKNIRHDEGAIGVFTNNIIKRQDMFEHIAKLLYGQMLYNQNKGVKND